MLAAAVAEQVALALAALPGTAATASRNHACSLEVWFGTRSTMTRRPRPCARGEQRVEVGERAEERVDVAVVGDVVAGVGLRRHVERGEPDRVDAEFGEVVEVLGDTRQVADAVAVGVGERARVDLVDHGVPPPVARFGDPRPG